MTPANLPLSHVKSDIDNMPAEWRDEFDAEVKSGNFLLGGKSIALFGHGAEEASRHWIACLVLGGFKCYRTTPFELIRRADGKPVPNDSEERLRTFLEAECVLIDDFFDKMNSALSDEQLYLFAWHLRELLRSGVTCIIACDNPRPTLDTYNDQVWQMVEDTFESIRHEETVKKTVKRTFQKAGNAKR